MRLDHVLGERRTGIGLEAPFDLRLAMHGRSRKGGRSGGGGSADTGFFQKLTSVGHLKFP